MFKVRADRGEKSLALVFSTDIQVLPSPDWFVCLFSVFKVKAAPLIGLEKCLFSDWVNSFILSPEVSRYSSMVLEYYQPCQIS